VGGVNVFDTLTSTAGVYTVTANGFMPLEITAENARSNQFEFTNKVPIARIIKGNTVVRDIEYSTTEGAVRLNLSPALDENSNFAGEALEDLEEQDPDTDKGGLVGFGYYAVGIERPDSSVTHIRWRGIISYAPTFNYSETVPVSDFASVTGYYWYFIVAREIGSEWHPFVSFTDYVLQWYVGDPNNGGTLVITELFSVTIENSSITND
jgi:hypothetical protein